LLIARQETIAVADSSAGGLISAALLSVPGASAYAVGGAAVYTRTARDTHSGPCHSLRSGLSLVASKVGVRVAMRRQCA